MKQRKLRLFVEEISPEDKIQAVRDAVGGSINGIQIMDSPDTPGVILAQDSTGQRGHLINSDGTMNNRSKFWQILFPEEEEAARESDKKSEAKEKLEAEKEALRLEQERQAAEAQFQKDEPILTSLGFGMEDMLPDIFNKIKKNLSSFLNTSENLLRIDGKQLNYPTESYVFGSAMQSLSRKLSLIGTGKQEEVILDPQLGKLTPTPEQQLDRGDLIQGTMSTLDNVMKQAVEGNDQICNNLGDKLRKVGNWTEGNYSAGSSGRLIILHENDSSRGISIAPGKLELRMVTKLESLCGQTIPAPAKTEFSDQELSNFRGKTAELLISMNGFARTLRLSGNTDPKFEEFFRYKIRDLMNKNIEMSRAAFSWLLEKRTGAVDLDDQHLIELLEDNLVELGTPEGLKNIFTNLNALGANIRSQITEAAGREADAIVPVGGVTGWGYKADTAICFNDIESANAVAERYGTSPVETTWGQLMSQSDDPELTQMYMEMQGMGPDDPVYYVGDSLKAYLSYTASKLGDLEGFHSVSDMLHGNWGGRGKIEHLDKVKAELGMTDAQQKAAARWWDNGPGKASKTIDKAFSDSEYFSDGKFRKANPTEAAKMMRELFAKQPGMDFDAIADSEVEKILTTGPRDNRKLVDLQDDVVRERVKEQLQRLAVTTKVNADLKKGVKPAKHAMAFMVWTSAGSYYDDAYDIRDLKRMEAYTFGQNDPIRDLGLSLMGKNNNYEIEGEGYTTRFRHKKSGGALAINRGGKGATRSDGTYVRTTRQSFFLTADLAKHYGTAFEMALDTASTLLTYIAGQQKLLEQLAKEYSN